MMEDILHLAGIILHLSINSTLNNGSGMQKRSDDKVDGMKDD